MSKLLSLLMAVSILACIFYVPSSSQAREEESPFFSYAPVQLENKIFLVGYEENSILDDLAYLALIPGSVYHHGGILYASPLIFWDDKNDDPYLNSHEGVVNFIRDWKYVSPDSKIIGVNLEKESVNPERESFPEGESGEVVLHLNGKNPEEIASKIAKSMWKSNEEAVVVNLPGKDALRERKGKITGEVKTGKPGEIVFTGTKDPSLVPTYHMFEVSDSCKWIEAYMEWGGYRGQDPDMQLFDWSLGEVDVSELWNVREGAFEQLSSYVRNPGHWGVSITYMPTEGMDVPIPIQEETRNPYWGWDEKNRESSERKLRCNYTLKVSGFPGTEFELPEVAYGASEVLISMDAPHNLGLVIRDENKAVISSEVPYNNPLSIGELGEGRYYACVVDLTGEGGEFELVYSWKEKTKRNFSEDIEKICNAAIFASMHNCPLFYSKDGKLSRESTETLETLGVNRVYSPDTLNLKKFKVIGIDPEEIRNFSGSKDIVFSTARPFSYVNSPIRREDYGKKVEGIKTLEQSYFFAPAAYAAAFHGTNLLLVENHFSQPAAWHRENWINTRNDREPPSVGDMVVTGKEVYSELQTLGLDNPGMEKILTIAGEFDLGPTWDRMFVGKAFPGRIFGTPVDVSYWFARNAFYPVLIFANPALEGVWLINGSTSKRNRGNLCIVPGGEEFYQFPVLNTWISHRYKFNERASEYWGLNYSTTSGETPYWSNTKNEIDRDVSRPGTYLADMTTSEAVPEYLSRAGYSSVFSTNFRATVENLNRGTLMWFIGAHGGHRDSGIIGFWSLQNPERNPWRAYEYLGSTRNPDTIAMSKEYGLDTNPGYDGLVTTIWGQTPETETYSGVEFDQRLDNLHSAGIIASSCLISNTRLHLAFIRHGSSFQIIDPWSTSWYANHAFSLIARSLALGEGIGEAYANAIQEVGISYLTEGWWWDILENMVYFGDPSLNIFVPNYPWEKPPITSSGLHGI